MIKATPYPNTLDECIDVVNEMQRHYSDPRYSDALAWLIGEAKKAQRYRKLIEQQELLHEIASSDWNVCIGTFKDRVKEALEDAR